MCGFIDLSDVMSDSSETLLLKYQQSSSWLLVKETKYQGFFDEFNNKIKMDWFGWVFGPFLLLLHSTLYLGLDLLASDWLGCQVLASDWSILEVGKYLRYLWLFTSSVCYKTIEQSSSKINKPRPFLPDSDTKTQNMSRKNTKLDQECCTHIWYFTCVCFYKSIYLMKNKTKSFEAPTLLVLS